MKLLQLINYLKKQTHNSFFIFGRYGFVHATPQNTLEQNAPTNRPTYRVDSSYSWLGTTQRIQHQGGFRLSTICCLCAGVLFGEKALDGPTIAMINTHF
ncbi:MAG: hypothetical protein V3T17_02335 [Pseudomonadales bacterium]